MIFSHEKELQKMVVAGEWNGQWKTVFMKDQSEARGRWKAETAAQIGVLLLLAQAYRPQGCTIGLTLA